MKIVEDSTRLSPGLRYFLVAGIVISGLFGVIVLVLASIISLCDPERGAWTVSLAATGFTVFNGLFIAWNFVIQRQDIALNNKRITEVEAREISRSHIELVREFVTAFKQKVATLETQAANGEIFRGVEAFEIAKARIGGESDQLASLLSNLSAGGSTPDPVVATLSEIKRLGESVFEQLGYAEAAGVDSGYRGALLGALSAKERGILISLSQNVG